MKLNALLKVLEQHPQASPRFVLPHGDCIPAHAHVTEVGHVTRNFIDCGGLTGRSESVLIQTHVGNDTDHRLSSDRLAGILRMGDRVLPHNRLDVEIEYDCCVVAQYPVLHARLAGEHLEIVLRHKRTHCLAQERAKETMADTGGAAAIACC
jgi:hypothetical protein